MTTENPSEMSLFERIGGSAAIDAAVGQFYERVIADQALAPFFEGINMPRHIKQVQAFFTTALGGPSIYRGRNMKDAHVNLSIDTSHFGTVAKHLVETLVTLGVPQAIIDEVVEAVSPLVEDIVNT
ncbi:MAG: hemoglobin [Candidatus Pelagisphaera sp.]|jgi:hemoglobin